MARSDSIAVSCSFVLTVGMALHADAWPGPVRPADPYPGSVKIFHPCADVPPPTSRRN